MIGLCEFVNFWARKSSWKTRIRLIFSSSYPTWLLFNQFPWVTILLWYLGEEHTFGYDHKSNQNVNSPYFSRKCFSSNHQSVIGSLTNHTRTVSNQLIETLSSKKIILSFIQYLMEIIKLRIINWNHLHWDQGVKFHGLFFLQVTCSNHTFIMHLV